ncbi:MAG: hypothetical protein AB7S69_09735 [Salinivirgaceae bacterium]
MKYFLQFNSVNRFSFKYLTRFLLIGFQLLLFSCSQDATYFDYINNAEQAIIDKKYKRAQKNYINAFEKYNSGRAYDFYNLVLCAKILENNELVVQFLDSCFVSGFTYKDLIKVIENENTNESFLIAIKSRADSLHQIYLEHKNSESYKHLARLDSLDQYLSYAVQTDRNQYYVDSGYYEIGKEITHMLQQGIIPQKELFGFGLRKTYSTIPWGIIRHYFGMLNRAEIYLSKESPHHDFYHSVQNDSSFYFELLKLIKTGKFSPYILRDGLAYNKDPDPFGFTGIKIINIFKDTLPKGIEELARYKALQQLVYVENEVSLDYIDSVNQNRAEINLCTYQLEQNIANYYAHANGGINDEDFFKFNHHPAIERFLSNKKVMRLNPDKHGGVNLLEWERKKKKWRVVKHISDSQIIELKL